MANSNKGSKDKPKAGRVEGEGSYSAARNYQRNVERAVADGEAIERGAEQASQALDGPEGESLRDAEKRGKAGPRAAVKRAR